MSWIPGGTFRMGDDNAYPEDAPAHVVTVSGFWMDEYAVTNTGSHALSRQQITERSPNAHLIRAHIPTPNPTLLTLSQPDRFCYCASGLI